MRQDQTAGNGPRHPSSVDFSRRLAELPGFLRRRAGGKWAYLNPDHLIDEDILPMGLLCPDHCLIVHLALAHLSP